jgi:hypothetical protein
MCPTWFLANVWLDFESKFQLSYLERVSIEITSGKTSYLIPNERWKILKVFDGNSSKVQFDFDISEYSAEKTSIRIRYHGLFNGAAQITLNSEQFQRVCVDVSMCCCVDVLLSELER